MAVEMQVPNDVVELLTARFGTLSYAGAGAWSTAFKFTRQGDDFVVRVGAHVSDFNVDAKMSGYSSAALPIPAVVEVDQLGAPFDHLYICVSTFAPGQPLEQCHPTEWPDLVPAVADLLDAMQAIDAPEGSMSRRWSGTLLASNDDDGRLTGWQEHLDARPQQRAAHDRAIERLEDLCKLRQVADARPTLLHCDLINANVHVDGGVITGVFDWGCRRWGDHLYELAWFECWDPWMENLDNVLLQQELVSRWGHEPNPDRLAACLLHIGADHLIYNAVKGGPEEGLALIGRLSTLDLL